MKAPLTVNRFVFVHGNGTADWRNPWTEWVQMKLQGLGYMTHFETMPDGEHARSSIWLPHLHNKVKVGPGDVIIGWSSGAEAAMRYAEQFKIRGSILISPYYTDLGDKAEKSSGYFDTPWNWAQMKANQQQIAIFYGDDDPYIPSSEFAYIAVQLSPDKHKIPGAGHFENRQDFPELIRYIEQTYQPAS